MSMIDDFWDNPFSLDDPIDFNPGDWPTIDPIAGMDPADPFYGLSDEDWRTIFGDGGGPAGGYGGGGGSGGSGGGGSSSGIPAWLRSLFGGGGGSGGDGLGGIPGWLLGLLGAGGTIYGGINNRNATREAQQRMEQAVEDANASTRSILGGASDAYRPYQDAGLSALQRLASMPDSNLAADFGPVGQRSTLAGQFGPIGQQSSLAGQFGPLGQASSLADLPRQTAQQSNLAAQFRPLGRR